MLKLSTNEIRKKWIEFFESKDHLFIEPKSLIPKNDPTLLWINSGVSTLKDYFSGKVKPPHKRLVNSQKAIRTNDIFNVGLTSRHHTFFEMLGNFSIGDYFKKEAIDWAYEFLINVLKIDVKKLWVTVFEDDQFTNDEWIKLGIIKEQIIKCNRDRNFWDVGNGPCGPCTEIHYDRGEHFDPNKIGSKLILEDIENDRYVEIWNIVFSQFNNDGHNNYTELLQKNIDTGAGLERIACISQDVPTNFDSDVFMRITKSVEQFSEYKYDMNEYFHPNVTQNKINFAYKVIADHMRATVFAIADGAIPSNKERGYILRRLIRRTMVLVRRLNINNLLWVDAVVDAIASTMGDFYTYLKDEKTLTKIKMILNKEVQLFEKTLQLGLNIFENSIRNQELDKEITFKLVDTYGFPIELIKEICEQRNVKVDLEAFDAMFKHHQLISKANKANLKVMESQNESLMQLDVDSTFHYEIFRWENAKIITLFNEDFELVDGLDHEDGYVVFDNTCFYATSGGQQHDTGYIIKNDQQFFVDDVFKAPNRQHVHHVKNASLSMNEHVILQINEQDRKSITANHTAEHLLHYCLKHVLSPDIKQEGAAKYPHKVTFDFTYHAQPTKAQLDKLENVLNEMVQSNFDVQELHMDLDEAKAVGAAAYFEDVYKKLKGKLRVIKMGPSIELCGGTHAHHTSEIERIKIVECASKGAGSWRITMVTGHDNLAKYIHDLYVDYLNEINHLKVNLDINDHKLNDLYNAFANWKNLSIDDYDLLNEKFAELKQSLINFKIEFDKQNAKQAIIDIKNTFNTQLTNKRVHVFKNTDNKNIFNALNELINENQDTLFISFNLDDNKIQYLLAINEKFATINQINLNKYIKELNTISNGKGGGKPYFVQGGTSEQEKLDELLTVVDKWVINA
ncbi:alanine--tRNA ligase [Ureaplasma parvum]|uniref:alanine--tRNA ligase n=1 Tax=Ureaplasma parvum TaxID=134821 RepID=UPI0011549B55|nr:alanine--tRNA ligase [Ureaplasma parvum]QDI64357.1 alanine--tRNA ligase [Ureaplasma parvum]